MSEKRLMKTPEELRQKARELLQMPKEDILTQYMFMEQEIEILNNKLKDIKSQLDYLETYSSKEDVFEDMKRRLDRIDKIIDYIKEEK